ncbi:unnamed protein product [Symbiodinium sp. CCMP2592]|nr:unnamed protein product [Symbiodinium sp. CCMP2592]
MFGMLCAGDDEPAPAKKTEQVEHVLRAVRFRGLPSPGTGTRSDPFDLDPEPSSRPAPETTSKPEASSRNPLDPEGIFDEDPEPLGSAPGSSKKPRKEKGPTPPDDPVGPEDEEDLRVPLSSVSLYNHRSRGHFPFDSNCEACCSSKGRVPARRLRRKLQRENQTIGLDFFYFGKLRVLLMMHLGSKYTVSLPAMHLDDPDLLHNINRVIREMGLVGKAVTFRMDQEAALGALAEKLTKCDSSPASATLIDVVPGYRPQSKGSIERQVETMKQGFWSVWLDLEKEVAKVKQETEAVELGKYRLPLGGLLWQACVFYVARCYNLWCTSVGDSSTSIDRLHEEIVNRTRTRPFGCLVQAQVSKSKAHHDKFRGARTVKAVYLGPVHAKGGGIFANQEVVNDEGDMEIDWLTNHYLESLFRGPDLRATSTAVAKSFDLKFGGTKIRCAVPQNAVSETSGEKLEPDLLYASMKLELEELESFKVGEVIPEREARRLAKENGRRVLTSRWVNTVKKKGLYRSRLVVRDYASMGGTTLSEGIYSPTTSLEGLRLLLSMLCRRGSVLSCDVSVAFMHAPVARAEFVELPNNVSTQGTGERVFVKLRKAMNGLRSAPLSWYCELAEYLRSQNFEASLDPTIFRRLTRKGLTIVLFYVDDLLIYSEDEAEGRRFYEELRKRYKLKLTGELIQDCPGEVSFLGRRIFRRKKGERTVYFGLDEQYLSSCCEEYGITKPAPKLPSLERRYAELLKKGQTELISPAAHERYRRTLGRLAWAALSRPEKQTTTALSSAEAELAALTEVAREGLYIALLVETIREGMPKDRETGYYVLKGYSDSESAVCISKMQTLLRKVRHIELRAAFLQELVARGRFTIEHIPGVINPADALTKSPTNESLASLYDASGLVDEPKAWESEPTEVHVSFEEPNENERKALEKWRAALAVHKRSWKRIEKLLEPYVGSPNLLLSHEWPERVTNDLGKDGGLCLTAQSLCGDFRLSALRDTATTTFLFLSQAVLFPSLRALPRRLGLAQLLPDWLEACAFRAAGGLPSMVQRAYHVCKRCQKVVEVTFDDEAEVGDSSPDEPSPPRPTKAQDDRSKRNTRILKSLRRVWGDLPAEAKSQLNDAGFEAPQAPDIEMEPDLLTLLQENLEHLPECIRQALPPPPPEPVPDPLKEGRESGNALRRSILKLKQLGQEKLRLQEDINKTKSKLHDLLRSMQSLQKAISEATDIARKCSDAYETGVLLHAPKSEVDLVLEALGLSPEALTETQRANLQALRTPAKQPAEVSAPPGLGPTPFQFGPVPAQTEEKADDALEDEPKDPAEHPGSRPAAPATPAKTRSRSPSRLPPASEAESKGS